MLRVSVIEGHALSLYKTRNPSSLPVSLKDSSSKYSCQASRMLLAG